MSATSAHLINLFIRLLSGDVLIMEIDPTLPVKEFGHHFCHSFHYATSAVERMVFLMNTESEASSEASSEAEAEASSEAEAEAEAAADTMESEAKESEDIFWSLTHHAEKTVGDLVKDADVLNLVIQPLEDPKWSEKLTLLRTILVKEKRKEDVKDEEIFSLYSTWLLTWIPPVKTNRYIRMKAFADAHFDVFHPLSEEDKEKQARLSMVALFRKWAEVTEQARRKWWAEPSRALIFPREVMVTCYHMRIEHLMTTPHRENNAITQLLRLWTVPELFQMGLTLERVMFHEPSLFQWFAQWNSLSAEL